MSDEQVNTAVEQVVEKQEDPSDKLTPDHPRFKEVLSRAKTAEEKQAQLERELAELKQQFTARQEKTGDDEFSEEEIKALERIEKGLAKRGFVKKDDLSSESFQIRLERDLDRLNEKYDGSNGMPKFVADEVYAFAKKRGLEKDLESAYKLMNYDALVEHEAKKRSQGYTPPTSERPTASSRNGISTELSPTDIASMSDAEWEANREKILRGLRG